MPTPNATIVIGSHKATLPILVGQSNFRTWYKSWHIASRGAKCWKVVSEGSDKETRPIQGKDESYDDYIIRLEKYDDKNDAAHSALLNGVDTKLQELVCACDDEAESARVAMRLLKDKFDYETTTSTIELFKEFSE